MPALVPGVVDVPLSPLNQTPSDTMGPLGRLQSLIDAQIRKYEPHYQGTTGVVPARVKVDPRDAFRSLPTASRSIVNGTVAAPTWSPAELLNTLGEQLVSIVDAVPRVFNRTTWSVFPTTRTLTQKLSGSVFHTSQHTIQAPTSASLAGVTCSVWTETVVASTGPVTAAYVGFKADNGAWVVTPTVLGTSGGIANRQVMAKVASDGARFWIVFNDGNATPGLIVYVFDTHGAFLAGTAATLPTGSGYPGFWDIIAATTAGGYTMKLAVPVAIGQNDDLGVVFHGYGWTGSAIIHTSSTDATVHCTGPLSWLTNDLGNGLAYLATGRGFSDAEMDVWAYEVTNLAQTHEYSSGFTFNEDDNHLDSITGYTVSSSGVNVVLSVGLLPADVTPPSSGPPVDPAFRFLKTFSVLRTGASTLVRTTQSVCQVSEAFEVDGEYYVYAYYQSGSGIGLGPTSETVTHTSGDYMIGAAVQALTVQPGDTVSGSPILTTQDPRFSSGSPVLLAPPAGSPTYTNVAIQAGDSVVGTTATGSLSGRGSIGIPDGTPLLAWTLSGFTSETLIFTGARLTVTGATGNNSTFDIIMYFGGTSTIYTPTVDCFGNAVTGPLTFTHAGSFTITPMAMYAVADISPLVQSDQMAAFFDAGHVTISNASQSGNNGTFAVKRIVVQGSNVAGWPSYTPATPTYGQPFASGTPVCEVWVTATTQVFHAGETFNASINPFQDNTWFFSAERFDSTYVGADLVVSADPAVALNVGTYPITGIYGVTGLVTNDATAVISQVFAFPFPTVSVQLTTQIAYTFKFTSITPDYTYQGAIVSLLGATAANNGTYKIVQINTDGSFIATPTNGTSNQVNEAFTGAETVTIFFNPGIQPEFQPTWLMVPLTGSQPVTGRFEYGLAYADWRVEENSAAPNLYPMALSSVSTTAAGLQVVLPYRAQNVTSSVLEATTAGEVDLGVQSFDSTVGLKLFTLSTACGQSYANSGELLIPGPMATVFTPSGFLEDGVNLALEAPFLVSQSVAAGGQLALSPGAIYFYVAVAEATDENGNRIFSPPSPALQVSMSGTNNVATIGGRLMFPLDPTGQPVVDVYGPTTRNVTISLYRTAWINGVPTTQRYKVTTDLNVNGLAPISTLNPSGFSFPNSFTWNYVDQNSDSDLTASEILYTDKGYLPRYPAPAFTTGVGSWKNREWVVGYDAAVWMSGEKTEGDAIWFNPAFRYVFPAEDSPLALAPMDDYLLVFCSSSVWYIPAAQFPDATGANGGLPTPVRLPFQNGSANGFALTIREGAVYDSTAGGLWLVTRNLENVWLSHPVQDSLTSAVTGLALDVGQRLFVQQADGPMMVYDGIPQAWYEWNTPTQGVLLTTYAGQAAYQDTATVNVITPDTTADVINGTTYGIAPDITIAPLNFGNTRGLKRVWEFQAVGEYRGPHRLNVVLSYPEDDQPDTTYAPFVPSADEPYVYPFNPLQEEASLYGIRLYADFVGVGTPGDSFSLEMVSAQVGMDPVGLNKRPAAVRLIANT